MELKEIKNTYVWEKLSLNSKFESEFTNIIKNSAYYTSIKNIDFAIDDDKLIVSYNSDVKNRDLDCQFKLYECIELFIDNSNLIINELSGRLESNYGYDFQNSKGGVIKTHYSCQVYDQDGIELSYQSYGDKYHLETVDFDVYQKDFSHDIIKKYNPQLALLVEKPELSCQPDVIGSQSLLLKQIRNKNNLGIVEVWKCSYNKDKSINSMSKNYYFNTFIASQTVNPKKICYMKNHPFATINDDYQMRFNELYTNIGLTANNYQTVAKERFLKELKEQKEQYENNPTVIDEYNLMIEKIKDELSVDSKTI